MSVLWTDAPSASLPHYNSVFIDISMVFKIDPVFCIWRKINNSSRNPSYMPSYDFLIRLIKFASFLYFLMLPMMMMITIVTRGALSRVQASLPGSVDHKAGSALYGWLSNCSEDFLIPMYICGKIFMKIWSAVFVWSGEPLLVFGGGMCSTDDFQNIMRTFLVLDVSLVKNLWRYDQ